MLVGRKEERRKLDEAVQSHYSSFVAVYGRRRIGKTFLINEHFNRKFTFSHAGLANGKYRQELDAFAKSLKHYGVETKKRLVSWLEAFDYLEEVIRKSDEDKKIVFIDELSWMDTPKSDFMVALESFWNGFCSSRIDVVLIVSASAASWMLSKIIHNRGGLYNRLTCQLHLLSFTLKECEEYVEKSGLAYTRSQILEYYMVFGGVPYYWTFLRKGLSVPQCIDNAVFSDNAPLKDEYKYLYRSVFKKPEQYIKIIEALGKKKTGLTRDEIIAETKMINNGTLSEKLEELESCCYIRKYSLFGNKKNAIFQLMDNFTIFHFAFIEGQDNDEGLWMKQIATPTVNTWRGLSFERVCLQHIRQIKNKLGILGVVSEAHAWSCKANIDSGLFGSQSDLLIVRRDQVINLCEIKYSSSNYILTNSDTTAIKRKVSDIVNVTKTKYAIFPTLITTNEPKENAELYEMSSVVMLDDLFAI